MNVETVLTVFLSTILVYSSIVKGISYKDFQETIRHLNYPLFMSWFVIGVEFLLAVLLLFETTHLAGEFGTILLFLSFYIVAGRAIWKKMKITCNCFGKSTEEELGWGTVAKITPLFAASIVCISIPSTTQFTMIEPIEWISVVGLTIGILNLYALWKNRVLLVGGE